jgi:hypothetical protein
VATKKSRVELLYKKPWVRLKKFNYARTIGGKPRECTLCGKTVIYALHGCVPKGMQKIMQRRRKKKA